jgi:agmatinase
MAAQDSIPWELPHSFLGLDEEAGAFDTSDAVILPVPWEATTSWMHGTRLGPRAIVEASRYIELWDHEVNLDASALRVHTFPAVELARSGAEAAMAELETVYGTLADRAPGRFRLMLGGEHSVSAPAIRATAARLDQRPTVLQFDAHADLRAEYEGTPANHACAMARVLDVADVIAVGIRGISREEVEVAEATEGVTLVYADHMWNNDSWMDEVLERLSGPIYITFDVDFWDPSFMPSTGTPEPGGGDWYKTLVFMRRVFQRCDVVAADIVELAPTPGLHAPDFMTAKLAYKMLVYRFEAELRTRMAG